MISASLDVWLRPNKTSQPNTRIMNKHSRWTDTNRDHASTRPSRQSQVTGHASSSEAVQGHRAVRERVLDEAIVGRIPGRCEQHPVQPDPPVSWSISYLLRWPFGISMTSSNSTIPLLRHQVPGKGKAVRLARRCAAGRDCRARRACGVLLLGCRAVAGANQRLGCLEQALSELTLGDEQLLGEVVGVCHELLGLGQRVAVGQVRHRDGRGDRLGYVSPALDRFDQYFLALADRAKNLCLDLLAGAAGLSHFFPLGLVSRVLTFCFL